LLGTLNRVMIVELGVPASLVAVMIALPVLFAPFRALIGFKSDNHRCELGWRRVPFIWKGTLWQFGGFAIMPFALLVLAGKGQASEYPAIIGHASAALAFLLVGAGVHTVQTAGLALATDLTPPESHPKVVGLMYVTLLLGMIVSALVFGVLLIEFSPGRLVQVVQGAAVATMVLNGIALWKQETRRPRRGAVASAAEPEPSFRDAWARLCQGDSTVRRLVVVGIGTMAFTMADILLEPFGGEVLGFSVSATTKLTALFAAGGLLGFGYASYALGQGGDAYRMARLGAVIGLPAFVLVMVAAPLSQPLLFLVGNFLIGFGGALFAHATLTATMNRAPKDQAGLALGAWGAVQATTAGIAMIASGAIRDLVNVAAGAAQGVWGLPGVATGYMTVYALEIILLAVAIAAILPLLRRSTGGTNAEAGGVAAGDWRAGDWRRGDWQRGDPGLVPDPVPVRTAAGGSRGAPS
jgi:BCD family chlorophyll transporter-like MFS transporter